MAPSVVKRLTILQESRAAEIQRIQSRFLATDSNTFTVSILNKRLDTIDKIWDEARATHAEIIVKDDALTDPYVTSNVFALMEDNYESLQNAILKALSNLEPSTNEGSAPTVHSIEDDDSDTGHRTAKLPKLDLPKFSGRYEDWDNFCDLFTSLVHDTPRLSNVTKLQYLKSCLTDNASDFVKDVSTTHANYLSTWEALKTRFSNPRLTVNHHLTTLMSLPYFKKESANELQSFSDQAQRIVRALKNLDMPVKHWDIWLVYILASRLDPESRKLWEAELSTRDRQNVTKASASGRTLSRVERFASFDDFIEFIDQRSHALCMIASEASVNKASTPAQAKSTGSGKISFHTSTNSKDPATKRNARKCSLCTGEHYIGVCPNFLKKPSLERRNEARRLRLCFNCLGAHQVKNCESKRRCLTCKEKHHSSLHADSVRTEKVSPKSPKSPCSSQSKESNEASSNVSALTANLSVPKQAVLLATAQVILKGPQGNEVRARALLDQGSEASFVTESIVQLLGLPRRCARISLTGLGASHAGTAQSTTQFSLHSIHDSSFHLETHALVLSRLTSQLPSRNISEFDITQLNGISLADPALCTSNSIDLILGADVYCQILRPGLRRFPSTSLVAQDTALGWVVSGSINSSFPWRAESESQEQLASVHFVQNEVLYNDLQRFWNLEEVPDTTLKVKPEDVACEQHYLNNMSRSADGRYMLRLPLKSEPPNVSAETKRMALGSLNSAHRRFTRDPQFAEAYCEFMKVYEKLGHMQKIPTSQISNPRAWYIPHHAVVQKLPWKLRVVFDASRCPQENDCLNEFLFTGPALQGDLSLILLQWRKYRFVFTTDIVKMFRQIRIHPKDQDLQRILWSPSPTSPPVEYRLTTVTYGTACAPYLAVRTLKQLVQDEQGRFPLGARCLANNTYIDDIFAGSHNLELAIQKRDELCNILAAAGIKLDKWAANHSELLSSQDRHNAKESDKLIASDNSVKTLGLRWNPVKDLFEFNFTQSESHSCIPTKRQVLSNVARVFDPLGWLAPITIIAKILIQDLWILKGDWDSPLPPEILKRWCEYTKSLSSVSVLSVDRWLGTLPESRCEIHGFADASSRAYAAAVYLKVQFDDGKSSVSLLAAKTKVCPIKTISIPNLELTAAALLVKLICYVQKLTVFKELSVCAWSDSQIVLSWLRKHPCHWKTFVANRVALIQTELPSAEWRHVPSRDNPADLATRGVKATELGRSNLWWKGPAWLEKPCENWPKPSAISRSIHTTQLPSEPEILSRFSCLSRLIRVVAYCRRPLMNLRNRKSGREISSSFLTTTELAEARLTVIRLAQATAFHTEIEHLKTKGHLLKRNPLRKLNPFVGDDQILRVGGRLSHSSLPHENKQPPILPHRSALSRLFIHLAHRSSLHGGLTLTTSFSLQHVWVLGRTRLIKTEIHNCITCQRLKPRLVSQLMGDLPKGRVNPGRPFETAGVDYAGPFQIRMSSGRGNRSYKGYIALFVCFTTHAVHLEVVSDLTTKAFLSAYRRFIGRRGICRQLYKDNGTTFVGAARELQERFNSCSKFYGEISTVLANDGTNWHFIPPNSPHCGGLWEAGIKSTKFHLKRVMGDRLLTFEELCTLLVEVEACLNSRPLCPLTNESDDLSALTPAHFLVGDTLCSLPESEIPNVPENRLTRFQLLQRMRNTFWKRWSTEYLQHLQERGKWRGVTENFALGQLVVVKDDRYPPAKWALGRVVAVHPGKDGLVRVVTVKTATTTFRRHIARLSPLFLPEPSTS